MTNVGNRGRKGDSASRLIFGAGGGESLPQTSMRQPVGKSESASRDVCKPTQKATQGEPVQSPESKVQSWRQGGPHPACGRPLPAGVGLRTGQKNVLNGPKIGHFSSARKSASGERIGTCEFWTFGKRPTFRHLGLGRRLGFQRRQVENLSYVETNGGGTRQEPRNELEGARRSRPMRFDEFEHRSGGRFASG